MFPNREDAWNLVCEYTESISLRRHMLAVEAAMRGYARHYGEDEETWGIVGLLHDFDYERYPDVATNGHPNTGTPILREHGYDEAIIRAILSHAPEVTGVERESLMEKALFACDELTGLIQATALVRPSKNIAEVKIKSIKKKWKDKRFAAGVHREDVQQGVDELGVELWEHTQRVLESMQGIATALGVDGEVS
ncbi:MAG: HD domain-containing protein [Chloroflexota bacterium]